MRVVIPKKHRLTYFNSLKETTNLSWSNLSRELKVNERLIRSWRQGEFTIPMKFLKKIKQRYDIAIPDAIKTLPNYWHAKSAGSIGAVAHNIKYGNPGTAEGRQRGGMRSIITHNIRHTGFVLEKRIRKPLLSEELAELIGILIGDGGITKYQVTVSLNYFKDDVYSEFVKNLFQKVFDAKVSINKSQSRSLISILASGKQFVSHLEYLGLPIGNKIKHKIDIPQWIKDNMFYRRACIRGIFDTDGSIYFDRHKNGEVFYKSLNIAFTSASPKLLNSIHEFLMAEGFGPTLSSNKSIRLRNGKDISYFFDIIGSSHKGNIQVFKEFTKGGFA
ncbi:MAG: LAGLIDADG family homing endonuclease [Patescibacteria group bacterium]